MTATRWQVPDDWSWMTIAEMGKVRGGGTPSSRKPSNFAEGDRSAARRDAEVRAKSPARDDRAYQAACNRYLIARQRNETRRLEGYRVTTEDWQKADAAGRALEKMQPGAVKAVERVLERRMVAERAKERDFGMEL